MTKNKKKDIDQKEKDIEVKHLYRVEKKPEDLREIYLVKLKELGYITSFEERYFALLYLIRIGLNILPPNIKIPNSANVANDDNASADNEDNADNKDKPETILQFKKRIRQKFIQNDENENDPQKSIYPAERTTSYSRLEKDVEDNPIFIYKLDAEGSGDIAVNTEDYKEGLKDLKEQQFRNADPTLSDIHDEVMEKLVECNVIPSMKPTIKDVIDKRIKKLYDKVEG